MNLEIIIPVVAVLVVLALVAGGRKKKKKKKDSSGGKDIRVVGNRLSVDLTYAKWVGAPSLAPQRLVSTHYTHAHFAVFLDEMQKLGCNTLLLKTAGFDIFQDAWKAKYHWLLGECQKRGFFCQINVGPDFWGANNNSTDYVEGSDQRHNWWGDSKHTTGYIERVVNEFRRYPHVFWELGNEVDHSGVDAGAFKRRAIADYLPAIRRLDQRPIGVSEDRMWDLPVDFLELHAPSRIAPMSGRSRPWVMNEVAGGSGLWKDDAIRGHRSGEYGPIALNCWAHGASGVSGATWLDISRPLNDRARQALRSLKR